MTAMDSWIIHSSRSDDKRETALPPQIFYRSGNNNDGDQDCSRLNKMTTVVVE